MDGNLAIHLEGIHKQYGTKVAVDDFDLSVPRATICGLLGPNGAGKTTTIRVMLDIIGADRGSVELLGQPPTQEARDRIGYLPEERGLYPKMKVLELLEFLGELKGTPRRVGRERAREHLQRDLAVQLGIQRQIDRSHGAFAQCLQDAVAAERIARQTAPRAQVRRAAAILAKHRRLVDV